MIEQKTLEFRTPGRGTLADGSEPGYLRRASIQARTSEIKRRASSVHSRAMASDTGTPR